MAPIGLNAQSTVIIPDYGGTGITEIGLAPPPGSIEAQEGQAFTDVFGEANALGGFWDFWENPTGANGAAAGPTGDTFSGNNWGQVYFAYGTDQAISYTLEYVPDPAALPGSSTAIFAPLSADSTLLPPTPLSQDVAAEIPYQYYPGSSTPSATYTVALGANTVGETLAISAPANPQPSTNGTTNGTSETESPSFVLGGTYTSTSDAVFQSSSVAPIAISGSGIFKTPLLSVAGFVNVTGGTLQGDQTYIDTAIPTSFSENYLPTGYSNVITPPSAALTLTGATAVFNASNFVVVGATPINAGNSATMPSTLLLQQGAQANVGFISVGENAMSSGIITVDGSTLNANNLVQIGESGTGAMTVQDKGIVNVTTTNGNVAVGSQMGGVGNLTITGTGSTMTVAGQMAVGAPNSTGNMLSILQGGQLICGNFSPSTNYGVVAGQTGGAFSNSGGAVLIDGTGSLWDVQGSLSVGSGGAGSVTVSNGGTLEVEGTSIDLGHFPKATGTLTFDGSGGTTPVLTFSDSLASLTIGDQGSGIFNVQDGAQISTGATVVIGSQANSTGSATVSGKNSLWSILGGLTVGQGGTGTLTIQDGYSVSAAGNNVVLGDQPGSIGTLIIDGLTSQLDLSDLAGNTTGALTIGMHGIGTLQVQNGGIVNLPATSLGAQTDGSGVIRVDSANSSTGPSTVTIAGALTVGAVSPGTPGAGGSLTPGGLLRLTGGGTINSAGAVVIGSAVNSFGSVSISGVGSQLNIQNQSNLTIGDAGNAMMSLDTGATFNGNNITIANQASSGSSANPTLLTLTGVGPLTTGGTQTGITVNGTFNIGEGGMGQLYASNGATIQTLGLAIIGDANNAVGSVVLTDMGTKWDASSTEVVVGNDGNGTLTIQNGASLIANTFDIDEGSGAGTVIVSGPTSNLSATESLNVGGPIAPHAMLELLSGGQVTKSTVYMDGKSSTILVEGVDPSSQTASVLDAGSLEIEPDAQDANITVEGGGILKVEGNMITVASAAGAQVTVTGLNSQFNAANSELVVGDGSQNDDSVTVLNGATLNSGDTTINGSRSFMDIGSLNGSLSSTWTVAKQGSQDGTISVDSGSILVYPGGTISADGQLTINTGSNINTMGSQSGFAHIVAGGIKILGQLNLSAGSLVSSTGFTDSGDAIDVLGGGELNVSAFTSTVNGATLGVSGSGSVVSTDGGGLITVTSGVTVGTGGTFTVSDGSATIGAASQPPAGTISVGLGGTLKDNGAVNGNLVVSLGGAVGGSGTLNGRLISSGTVAPGDPQIFTVNGDYEQDSGGVLLLTLAGADSADYDHLVVTGQASLESGSTLELDFIDSFAPIQGDTFDFLSYGSLDPINDGFSTVEIEGLEPGFDYAIAPNGSGSFELTALNNAVAVPEPGACALLVLGAAVLASRYRGRRRIA